MLGQQPLAPMLLAALRGCIECRTHRTVHAGSLLIVKFRADSQPLAHPCRHTETPSSEIELRRLEVCKRRATHPRGRTEGWQCWWWVCCSRRTPCCLPQSRRSPARYMKQPSASCLDHSAPHPRLPAGCQSLQAERSSSSISSISCNGKGLLPAQQESQQYAFGGGGGGALCILPGGGLPAHS